MTEQLEQRPRERSPELRNVRGLLREVFSEIEAACGGLPTPHVSFANNTHAFVHFGTGRRSVWPSV